MANASKDSNNVPTILGTLNTDGSTPIAIKVDSSSHQLQISDGISGSDNSGDTADRDNNNVPVFMGVSNADGITPVAIYADSSGNLLVDSS